MRRTRRRARKRSLAYVYFVFCMSAKTYNSYIKAKEKAKDKERGKDKDMGKGKESSAVADKGQHELKRETAKETHARISELQDQWLRG